jgi:hypothetical protein
MLQSSPPKNNPQSLSELVLKLLEDAADMHLSLSEEDSAYDLNFIREKLAKVGVFQERLSDIQMKLTRVSIDANVLVGQTKQQLSTKERELKLSSDYRDKPRAEKTPWLEDQLSGLREDSENWLGLFRLVSEVKEAVGNRVSTMKRLDSDLRLHAKLYEEGVRAGATSPSAPTRGSKEIDEVDLK